MSTPSLSLGMLNGIYVASSDLYTATSNHGSLASLSARVDYAGVDAANRPAPPAQNRRLVTAKVRLTFKGGSGSGQFQARYSCVGSERDPGTSGWAYLQFPTGGAKTNPNELSVQGWLPPAQFEYEIPLLADLTLSANAIANVQPRYPGPVEMTAEAHLIEIAGFQSAGDAYPLTFVWEPIEIAVTVSGAGR
jgi:hypothetical protein